MAPNKFASMLHRRTNKLTLVLVYVLLDWILIAMIILNSLFSYLIVKYTDYFGLKRPCVFCSRIDRGRDKRVRKDMICDEHAVEISELGFCQTHQKLVNCGQSMCQNCCSLTKTPSSDWRCCCCNERLEETPVSPNLVEDGELHFCDCTRVDEVDHEKQSEEQSIERENDEVVEEEEDMQQLVSVEFVASEDDEIDQDSAPALDTESRGFDGDHSGTTTDAPLADVHASECSDNMAEMEEHEEATGTDTDVSGEAQKLNSYGIEVESDFEETELQEISLNALDESSEHASTVENLTRALNEAYAELEQERNDAAEASSQTMAMITKLQEEKAALQLEASQYRRMTDEQIEFDEEAVLLLDEIVRRRERENQELEKELELYKRRFEKMRRSEENLNMVAASESVSVCCSSFGDQDSDGVSTEDYDHHVTPTVEPVDPFVNIQEEKLSLLNRLNELEKKLMELNKGEPSGIEEEVSYVYERLQELEEDNEFLRNCVKSVKKGDEGMSLVQEILQHLRALRRLESY